MIIGLVFKEFCGKVYVLDNFPSKEENQKKKDNFVLVRFPLVFVLEKIRYAHFFLSQYELIIFQFLRKGKQCLSA